jgi:argininosuccinate lyase
MVRKAIDEGCWLADFSIEEFQAESPLIQDDIYEVLDISNAVKRRDVRGGTAPNRVLEQIEKAHKMLAKEQEWLAERTSD